MEKFLEKLGEKMLPVANAIGNQRHMQAIRNGLISIMPLTIIGSFFVIFLNIPIDGYAEFIAPYKDMIDVPFRFTVGIMALYSSYTIAAHLGRRYKLDSITAGFSGMLAFILSQKPVMITEGLTNTGTEVAGRFIEIAPLSAAGLFGAIIGALLAVEILQFFTKKNWVIKMPDGVPPVVSQSFSALFPTLAIIIVFWGTRHILNININEVLTTIISPLKVFLVGNNLLGGLITVLLICGFWVMGIHGPNVLGPIIRPFWDQAIAENSEQFAAGVSEFAVNNIFTEQFLQWFLWIGGSGTTLALVVMFMFSKSQYLKQLGKLSILPGIFNINEPVIFGAPIVMNPILAIPFILTPMVNLVIAYVLTIMNVLPRMVARPPFTVPAPLGAMMSTNWNLMSGVMVIVFFIISYIIYYPFFKMFEKKTIEEMEKNVADAEAGIETPAE